MSTLLLSRSAHGLTVGEIAALTGAEPRAGTPLDRTVHNVAPLDRAGPGDLVFFDSIVYRDDLYRTRAEFCMVAPRFEGEVPERVVVLRTAEPYRAFVQVARALFPGSLRPSSLYEAKEGAVGAHLHPTARLEAGVTIDPGAVIGPRAEVGGGTAIGPSAVVGPDVCIGRDCMIGRYQSMSPGL